MIIQIGTEVDESRILWKHKESDEWKRADIDDLIDAYENRLKGKVLCSFLECFYNENGICAKEFIDLDERVEDIFIGCPDAEWKDGIEND